MPVPQGLGPVDRLRVLSEKVETLGPQAWEKLLSVNSNIHPVAEFEVPEVRIEGGGRAFLKGVYQLTAEIAEAVPLFTVPVSCRAKAKTDPICTIISGATGLIIVGRLALSTSGVAACSSSLPTNSFILLDGVSWNIT